MRELNELLTKKVLAGDPLMETREAKSANEICLVMVDTVTNC